MKNTTSHLVLIILLCLGLGACQTKPADPKNGKMDVASLAHLCQKKLTDIIVVDIFSPPVASRIYAYCSLAFYEAARLERTDQASLTARLKGFAKMPQPNPGQAYDYRITAIVAFCETAKKVTFSAAEINTFEEELLADLAREVSPARVQPSRQLGLDIAAAMAQRLKVDHYLETRGMERFEVDTQDPGRWVPTAPDYADGLEPHWSKILPLVLDSAAQCSALPFPAYDPTPGSPFFREMKEVFDLAKSLTKEQQTITVFWDDNPFVSKHIGHVMFQDKKMTPGGHWMAICRTACILNKTDGVQTAYAYALTSIALHDAFIACWYEKYRSVRIRPQTAIQRLLEETWLSFLQTPPFPEHTSGHSTISAAAAEVLTEVFGDNFAYTDSTEVEYGLPVRRFTSFRQAAEEASISRVYGGIHFRSGCENGKQQGQAVAKIILTQLR